MTDITTKPVSSCHTRYIDAVCKCIFLVDYYCQEHEHHSSTVHLVIVVTKDKIAPAVITFQSCYIHVCGRTWTPERKSDMLHAIHQPNFHKRTFRYIKAALLPAMTLNVGIGLKLWSVEMSNMNIIAIDIVVFLKYLSMTWLQHYRPPINQYIHAFTSTTTVIYRRARWLPSSIAAWLS